MEYISAKEIALKWGISQRRVATLCAEKRIKGAIMVGNMWIIPDDAEKPLDARHTCHKDENSDKIKPFLKWAGGKGQLLNEISNYYPFKDGNIKKYAEPFVGGGAVLFDILNSFDLEEVYISDINHDLINTYIVIKENAFDLIELLSKYQSEYDSLTLEKRKLYYLGKRDRFNYLKLNETSMGNIEKAALMIFLNKTCFNGLYRENKKGLFNVPMGAYKNPCICDEKNISLVSNKLKYVRMICGDYKESLSFIDKSTFTYFDPPYRPLTNTSNFTSYTSSSFNDESQIQLSEFVKKVNDKGALFMVSNSDPKNCNELDDFFDNIYSDFKIKRVQASRMINCKSSSRGKINELLISNF